MTDKQTSKINNLIDQFISYLYVRRIWGVRCGEIEEDCICCQKWIEHDDLFNSESEIL